MTRTVFLLTALAAAAAGQSTLLDLSVQSGGQNAVTVAPGATVPYAILGTLTNAQNEGLAMFSLDLGFTGGPLAPALAPVSGTMVNFNRPLGFTNPAGFGGTPSGGGLLQVGGAQNTIASTFAPVPTGAVVTGVAWPGQAATLVSGSLVAPSQVGTYVLTVGNVFANVIKQGETGVPFWKVSASGAGAVTPLTVSVRALSGDVASLSIATPGVQTLSLDAGGANAFRIFFLLGTISGTSPGIPLANGTTIPLNYDPYLQYTFDYPNGPILANSAGLLNAQGRATSWFVLPPGLPPEAASLTLHHAFVLLFPLDFASNPEVLDIAP